MQAPHGGADNTRVYEASQNLHQGPLVEARADCYRSHTQDLLQHNSQDPVSYFPRDLKKKQNCKFRQ